MRYIPLILLLMAGCKTTEPQGTRVIFKEVKVEVQRPCPVTKPQRPAALTRPLPTAPGRLIDLLSAKLLEWAGPGGYGERADAAIETCTKP